MNHVVVKVIGTQRDIYGQENSIEIKALGNYYRKNGIYYVTYEDKELSHEQASTTTVLKVYSTDHVTLLRMGSVEQKQEFRQGQKSYSTYHTPYGTMRLAVVTKQMDVSFGTVSAAVDIQYELEVDGQWQSDNTLSISIQEGQNFGH